MPGTFHWIRLQTFCYATEDEGRVMGTFAALAGTEKFSAETSEGEHGNRMTVLSYTLSHQRECRELFSKFDQSLIQELLEDVDNRIGEDCTFRARLDKQRAVQGEYAISHTGDVITVTGKVAANPAKRDIAAGIVRGFLESLIGPYPRPSARRPRTPPRGRGGCGRSSPLCARYRLGPRPRPWGWRPACTLCSC